MDDKELIDNFIRRETVGVATHLLVCQIDWKDAHTPTSRWKVAAKISGDQSAERLAAETARIIDNRRYFRICQECGERNPCCWMVELDMDLCQRCASDKYGVAF